MGAKPQDLRRRVNELGAMMDARGLTDHALAEIVGTTYQNVNRHKLGRAIPSLDLAYAYARALDASVESVFFPRGYPEWTGTPRPCPIARKTRTVSHPPTTTICSRCGVPTDDHDRVATYAPHPNDWRRKLAEDERALMKAIVATRSRDRVAMAIKRLNMPKKRAFAILGAWTDWGWYEPSPTLLFGDLTEKGEGAVKLLDTGANKFYK